jgi:pyruvate kinase
MCLYWGVKPLPGRHATSRPELIAQIAQWGRAEGLLKHGDRIILVTGTQTNVTGHNHVMVHEIN